MLACSILTDEAEIARLAAPWQALQEEVGLSPFTSFAFVWAWWESVGKPCGASLFVVTCREGGKLKGLLPFSITPKHGVRVLRYAGHDAFYLRNSLATEKAALVAMWAEVTASRAYDFANIKNAHEGSAEEAILESFAMPVDRGPVYYKEQAGLTRQTLWAAYAKRERRKVKKVQDVIRADAAMVYEVACDAASLAEAVPFLVGMKTAWCEKNDKKGLFRTPYAAAFYKAMGEAAVRLGQMRLLRLRREGKLIAVLLCLVYKDTLYSHTVSYDPAFLPVMPGLFLNIEAAHLASEEGLRETNFMEGPERFKSDFSTGKRMVREFAFARTMKGRLFCWVYALKLRLTHRGEAA